MEIKGKLTLLISNERTTIEIKDGASAITFVRLSLTPEQLSTALSRQANTEIEKCEVFSLDRVGKEMVIDDFVFEMPDISYNNRVDKAKEVCLKTMQEKGLTESGWIPDQHFGSQNSFFERSGTRYARTIIRKWV